jgi:hypothetical protein
MPRKSRAVTEAAAGERAADMEVQVVRARSGKRKGDAAAPDG